MRHDLERIKAIEEAGGDISRQTCRSKGGQCPFYDITHKPSQTLPSEIEEVRKAVPSAGG
jgi:hypothetical protein